MTLVQKEPQSIYIGSTPVIKVMKGNTQVRPEAGEKNYTISNIPTTDTNKYINVAKMGKTIQKVVFSLSFYSATSNGVYCSISGNNSSNNRYGIAQPEAESIFVIRGRLNGNSDTRYREIPGFVNDSTNTVVFTINRDGNCNIVCNGTSTDYTAGSGELNVIQTIMNLSDMNVYAAQKGSAITGDKIDVTVYYS